MRSLVIAEHYPWPAVDGYRQRLHHMIAGLGQVGPIEVLALDRRPAGSARSGPPTAADEWPVGVESATGVATGELAGLREWLPRWLRGDMPRRVLAPDWSALTESVSARLADHVAEPIDLVWFSHVDTWWALRDVVRDAGVRDAVVHDSGRHDPATIVDFDNLENLALQLRRRTGFPGLRGGPGAAKELGRWTVSRGFDLVDERRWSRLQDACAAAVDRVVVCSELDRVRSGCDNAVVIGNGASVPADVDTDRVALRSEVPTMVFVGALDYEPNGDAVRWFISEILPLVRAVEPRARFVVVGRGADVLGDLAGDAGVEVLGSVEDLQPHLDAADVAVVPIRVGAGTRLKVVEALANHLPVVTTTVGCEGIDVVDGASALIADDAATFAARCAQLLGDGRARQRLADAGAELFTARYEWGSIEARLGELAREVTRGRG